MGTRPFHHACPTPQFGKQSSGGADWRGQARGFLIQPGSWVGKNRIFLLTCTSGVSKLRALEEKRVERRDLRSRDRPHPLPAYPAPPVRCQVVPQHDTSLQASRSLASCCCQPGTVLGSLLYTEVEPLFLTAITGALNVLKCS